MNAGLGSAIRRVWLTSGKRAAKPLLMREICRGGPAPSPYPRQVAITHLVEQDDA